MQQRFLAFAIAGERIGVVDEHLGVALAQRGGIGRANGSRVDVLGIAGGGPDMTEMGLAPPPARPI